MPGSSSSGGNHRTPPGAVAGASGASAGDAKAPCKFFGSAKGCSNEPCTFSHEAPNSVAPCSFKQRLGYCERGEACTFRHVPWASAEQARAHYASRGKGAVEESTKRYKQLHRDSGEPELGKKVGREHVEMEVVVEREMQVETYGSNAVKMMEKMGYKVGVGLGKEQQGSAKLAKPCLALEKASQTSALGFGNFSRDTVAERAARLADARAQKRPKVEETAFFQHNLLSDDEDSEGEGGHVKVRDKQLPVVAS